MRIIVWLFMIMMWILIPLALYSMYLGGHWDRTFTESVYILDVQACQRRIVYKETDFCVSPEEHISAYNYTDQYVYGQMREYSHLSTNPNTFLGFRFTDCHFGSTGYFIFNLESDDFIYIDSYLEFLTQLQELKLNPELKWPHWYWDEEKQRVFENRWSR